MSHLSVCPATSASLESRFLIGLVPAPRAVPFRPFYGKQVDFAYKKVKKKKLKRYLQPLTSLIVEA